MTLSLNTASRPLLHLSWALGALCLIAGPPAARAQDAPPYAVPPPPMEGPVPPPLPPRRPVPPLPPRDPGEQTSGRPLLSLGNEAYFVKPILAMAGGIDAELLLHNVNQGLVNRYTTVAITRFGVEGRLGPYVSFRSEFERNIGAHGSGVWEGTASFSVRDQFIRLERWGFKVDGGIILDEASIDFFSAHTADLLLADHYTRDPLLYSGFNRGQGVKASWGRWGLRLGLAFTEGNPLSTSTSFQVGGSFSGNSNFWNVPLGNFRIGQPDDQFDFRIVSPSLTFVHKYVEAKAMGQWFWIDYDTNSKATPVLSGSNLRANLMLKRSVGPVLLAPFGNFSWVDNQVLSSVQAGGMDQLLGVHYKALTYSAGLDLFIAGRSGVGFSYADVMQQMPTSAVAGVTQISRQRQRYVNGGLTYWVTDYVALGARVAYYRIKTCSLNVDDTQTCLTYQKSGQTLDYQDTLAIFATMRLII